METLVKNTFMIWVGKGFNDWAAQISLLNHCILIWYISVKLLTPMFLTILVKASTLVIFWKNLALPSVPSNLFWAKILWILLAHGLGLVVQLSRTVSTPCNPNYIFPPCYSFCVGLVCSRSLTRLGLWNTCEHRRLFLFSGPSSVELEIGLHIAIQIHGSELFLEQTTLILI